MHWGMRILRRPWGVWPVLILLLASGPLVRADVTTYTASDPGVGPGAPSTRPNSTAEAALFGSAAGPLGSLNTITFAGLANNLPGADNNPLTVAAGVTLSVLGTDHNPPTGIFYGVSTSTPSPVLNGYSTSPGVAQFFDFVPQAPASGIGTASMTFQFGSGTSAFGLYITGFGNVPGNTLTATFNDGTPRSYSILGSLSGGVQFWGFTVPGASITSVTFTEVGATPTSRDAFGIDTITYTIPNVPVPEPAAALLLVLGGLGLLAPRLIGWIGGNHRRSGD
jgi:hypothetical protein